MHGKDFTLSDNIDTLPIASSFPNPENSSTLHCFWNFNVSPGYKLKIHLKYANLTNLQTLVLKTKDAIWGLNSGVQYFDGSSFTIIYNNTQRGGGGRGFGGIVTAVKKNPKLVSNCITKGDEFSSPNFRAGYEGNMVGFVFLNPVQDLTFRYRFHCPV